MIVHKPNYKHWKEVDRVLRYLEVIMNHGLHFFGIGSTLEYYSDANWAFDKIDLKSTRR